MYGRIGPRENAQFVGKKSTAVHQMLHKQFRLVENSSPGKSMGPEDGEGSPGQILSSATFGVYGLGSFT